MPEQTAAAEQTKPKKKEKAAKPVVEKIIANGVTRPKADTKTVIAWEEADRLSAAEGKPANRKAVMDACTARGVNEATAATQYGRWRKFHGLKGTGREEASKPETEQNAAA